MTKVLCNLTADEYAPYRGLLMGYTVTKDSKGVRVYDNWVNRIVLGYELPKEQEQTILSTVRDTNADIFDKLKDFQLMDVKHMQKHEYSLNRNKMGAGKTIEFIALCRAIGASSILVCCPKAVIAQWVAQFKRWWPERANDVYAYTPKRPPKQHDIIIVNYEKLTSSKYSSQFREFTWDMFGVDEAHMIKNHRAQRTIAVKNIPAKHRNAMTGTPVMRNPDDLYSILQFLNPEITGGSYWNFVNYFCCVVDSFFGMQISGLTKNDQHVAVMHRILKEISVYNEIEVAEGKQHIVVPLTPTKEQARLYNQIRKILIDELPNTVTIPNGAVLVTRLIQTTSCPKVFDSDEKKYAAGIKFDWIKGLLENNPDLKIVVFSKFAQVIKQLSTFLQEHHIECATYTGQHTASYNEESKKAFVENPHVRVLAGTIDAMGTGIDGLQFATNVCVFLDRDYRPGINEQAEDRIHRTGQSSEVLCYYLECEKTIDTKVAKLNTTRTEDIRKLLEEKP